MKVFHKKVEKLVIALEEKKKPLTITLSPRITKRVQIKKKP